MGWSASQPLTTVDVLGAAGAVVRLRRHGNPGAATRLLLSHGNGFAIAGYVEFWRHFLRDFDVVAFDMRNHGQNPLAEPPGHDYPHMMADIAAVTHAARAEFGAKPTVGVFHSMSAQSALLQAMQGGAADDENFVRLILFDPPNVPPADSPARQAMLGYLRMLAVWAGARRDSYADPGELAAEYAASRTGQAWTPTIPSTMAEAVLKSAEGNWRLSCPPALEASMYRQGMTLPLWPQCTDVPVPVTLVGADPERQFAAATGLSNRQLAADGGFDYRTIPGTSHLMQLEQPEACAELVLDLLR
ncbi:MAG: alpha/beta hydrolase [Alphaproteobacteria bacterium]|nr:alpha/beta hydrolase [Alphaproteobacteria bacterium]